MFALQPIRLDGDGPPVQPSGNDVIDSRTRSKNVPLRVSVSGIDAVVPASTVRGCVVAAPKSKVPSVWILDTSSSGSWDGSGSVDVFQLRLPR